MDYKAFRKRERRLLKQAAPKVSEYHYNIRERVLLAEGFLPFERFWLAQHSISGAVMRHVRAVRRQELRKERKQGFNLIKWQQKIYKRYRDNGWIFRDGSLNPFDMVDAIRKEDELPETPQKKRRKGMTDYVEYKNRTLNR